MRRIGLRQLLIALLLVVGLVGSVPTQASESHLRTEVKRYNGTEYNGGIGYSHAFSLTGEEHQVDVAIEDDLASETLFPWSISFWPDCSGKITCRYLGEVSRFCGSTVDIVVPSGAVEMIVQYGSPLFPYLPPSCAAPGVATRGTITAVFSKEVPD